MTSNELQISYNLLSREGPLGHHSSAVLLTRPARVSRLRNRSMAVCTLLSHYIQGIAKGFHINTANCVTCTGSSQVKTHVSGSVRLRNAKESIVDLI